MDPGPLRQTRSHTFYIGSSEDILSRLSLSSLERESGLSYPVVSSFVGFRWCHSGPPSCVPIDSTTGAYVKSPQWGYGKTEDFFLFSFPTTNLSEGTLQHISHLNPCLIVSLFDFPRCSNLLLLVPCVLWGRPRIYLYPVISGPFLFFCLRPLVPRTPEL